jgi:Beta-lactamase enzyme family/ORF 12 gene product N-terminal
MNFHRIPALVVAVLLASALTSCSKNANSKSASADSPAPRMTDPPPSSKSDPLSPAPTNANPTSPAPTSAAPTSASPTSTFPTVLTSTVPINNATAPAKAVTIPSTPTGKQLQWIIDHGQTATSADLAVHFSSSFLAQVPSEQLLGVFRQLGTITPVEVGVSSDKLLDGLVTAGDGTKFTVSMKLDVAAKIEELLFKPFTDLVPSSAKTWSEVDQDVKAVGLNYSLFAGEVGTDGSLRELYGTQPDASGPLGSEFKLYVLGALSKAIEAKTIGWDEELTITDALKSIPSGELQDRASGSKVTVREAAQKMIEISDNTAADLLINRLGRANVEAVLGEMGMGDTSRKRTVPFITTREMSILKFRVEPTVRAKYETASGSMRSTMLKELPAELPDVVSIVKAAPTAIDTIEWFASPKEVSAAHAWLDKRADLPGMEPIRKILGTNPGLPLDDKVWKRHSFKGGSEPGVLALSWLLERADGKRFVIAINTSSPKSIEENGTDVKLFGAVTGAFNVLATQP